MIGRILVSSSVFSVCLFSAGASLALDKVVAAGEEWLVGPDEQSVTLERLVLGDNAKVRFKPGVERWHLTAKRAEIGDNVLIDGRGAPGQAGVDAPPPTVAQAPVCDAGAQGEEGGDGSAGAAGVDLSLSLGIAAIGSLNVVSDGGAGGRGGRGGQGQAGGDISKCRGGDGGAGGTGGAGGAGGDAGELTLVYRPLTLDTATVLRRIEHSSEGGAGGAAGLGGQGGAAVEGRYMKGSFAGNKKWLAGGEPGATGPSGSPGEAGRSKVALIELDHIGKERTGNEKRAERAKSLPVRELDDTVSLEQKLRALEARMQAMERRLRLLEQNAKP